VSWENGKTEPRPPQREAYARLLDKLAELYPAPVPKTAPAGQAAPVTPVPETPSPPVPDAAPSAGTPSTAAPTAGAARTVRAPAPVGVARTVPRRPAATKTTVPSAQADPRFANGPLAVLDIEDGHTMAYCVGGLVLDVPAKSIPALVDWTLNEARLGVARLHGSGKDADPLIVLTPAACERYGLPVRLSDEERSAGRLPEGHKVIKQLARADWQLTRRGFGPWARIYRPAQGGKRACVQLCIRSTNAAGVMPHSSPPPNSPACWAPTPHA